MKALHSGLVVAALAGYFFGASGAEAQEPAATTELSSQPLLLQKLQLEFRESVSEAAAPIVELQEQYQTNLLGLKAQAEKQQDLDAVLAIQNEIENFRLGRPADAASSADLRRLQSIYRDALIRRRAQFRQGIRPVLDSYSRQLETLEKKLTADGDVSGAVQAREEKERITELAMGSLSRVSIDLGVLDEGYDPIREADITVIPNHRNTVTDVGKLEPGTEISTNRPYAVTAVPPAYRGMSFMKMETRGDIDFTYVVEEKCLLYALLIFDNGADGTDLDAAGWERLEDKVQTSGPVLHMFKKVHKPGTYTMDSQGVWPYMLTTSGTLRFRREAP